MYMKELGNIVIILWCFYPVKTLTASYYTNNSSEHSTKSAEEHSGYEDATLSVGRVPDANPIRESSDKNLTALDSVNGHTTVDSNDDPPSGLYLYHNDSRSFYWQGLYGPPTQGPCGKLMRLYRESTDSNIGVCQCKKEERYCTRPLLHSAQEKRCYFMHEQGPCRDGEWFVRNENGDAECQLNPCPKSKPTLDDIDTPWFWDFYFKYEGECYKTNVTNTKFCPENEKVFVTGDLLGSPTCFEDQPGCSYLFSLSISKPGKCPDNTVLQTNGVCASVASFD